MATVLSPVVSDPSLPSGWFPDPLERYDHRYFNGTAWTSDVSRDGQRHVDPLGTSPGGAAPGPSGANGAATGAMVLGSIALLTAWIPFIVVVGFVLAVLAIVFGVRGLRRSRTSGVGRTASIAGIVMGGLGVATTVVGVVLSVIVWNAVVDFVEPGRHDVAVSDCEIDGRAVTVTGTIENQSRSTRSYTVFVEVGGRTEAAVVDDVDPAEVGRWSTTVTTRSVADSCEPVLTVHGPLPFGLEMDPVNR